MTAASVGPLLSFENVTLRFRGVTALDAVSFDLGTNELFAIIGPNGAGKTSIFNCVNQVYRPQAGTIVLDGVSLVGKKPHETAALGVARTFQNVALFANLDVVDNLMLGRHHRMRAGFLAGALWIGKAKKEEVANRARCEELIDFLQLQAYRGTPVGVLPYGVQKRIELGRALALDPKLLLLDEPVAGMNLEETEDMAGYILDIKHRLGISMVLVEHDMHMVMDIADRVMVLDFGRVIASGTPAAVQSNPDVIRAYLGEAV